MTRLRLLIFLAPLTFIISLLLVLSTAVLAQEEPPPPYSGLKNPLPWNDAAVQQAGKELYQRSCLGCHGSQGDNIAGYNFSTIAFRQSLEGRADFPFWVLSEGRLSKGMPPFKSSLSEEQRWQVLTYLWSLSTQGIEPEATPAPIAKKPAEDIDGSLLLTVTEQTQPGQPMTLTAAVKDKGGNPVGNATVKFFVEVDFFTNDEIEIAEAATNAQGIASFEYTPRYSGALKVSARYGAMADTTTIELIEPTAPFYQPRAGLHESTSLPEIFIGPQSALKPSQEGEAPVSGLRIPGGLPFLLLMAYVLTVILVWSMYLRVMYQLFRISAVNPGLETNNKLIPVVGLTVMAAILTMLVFILITGPYSHPHLGH